MIGLLHNRRHIRRITPISPSRNPQGPSTGEWRVLRGGSWVNSPNFLRAAYRSTTIPRVPSTTAVFVVCQDCRTAGPLTLVRAQHGLNCFTTGGFWG